MAKTDKKDIFDTNDTSDLPKNLRIDKTDKFADCIIKVFEKGKEQGLQELNVNQVMVAFYRLFNEEFSKPKNNIQIMNKLFSMAKKENALIEKVANVNGTYRLKK